MNSSPIINIDKLNVYYNPNIHAIKNISLILEEGKITSIIGPKECGKTSLLRSINRLHELNPKIKTTGKILFHNRDIKKMNAIEVRKRIGMVFTTPSPFPNMTIAENILIAYDINKIYLSKKEKEKKVQECLTEVDLWEEIKNDLHEKPDILPTGRQQLLCIARTIAIDPEIILMDEPTSTLDPAYITKVENLLYRLKKRCTILLATQNLSQAARLSDFTLFMESGEVVEYGSTSELFWNPKEKKTEKFINI